MWVRCELISLPWLVGLVGDVEKLAYATLALEVPSTARRPGPYVTSQAVNTRIRASHGIRAQKNGVHGFHALVTVPRTYRWQHSSKAADEDEPCLLAPARSTCFSVRSSCALWLRSSGPRAAPRPQSSLQYPCARTRLSSSRRDRWPA
ncbi:hypothetical protein BST61_g10468 [Cercospora zeina]